MSRRSPSRRSILLVKHGPQRGREPDYLLPIARYLHQALSAAHIKLRVHATGQPTPAIDDDLAAVVFWLADPLRELYPDCYDEAAAIAARAREKRIRLLNPPAALSNTVKSVQARLWREAGIPAAACAPFATRDELQTILDTSQFPLIIRPDHSHSQAGICFCPTRRDAEQAAAQPLRLPGVVIPFVDTRSGYENGHGHSVWSRFYHKKRVFVFGDRVCPNHVFFSRHPIVGISHCTFFRYRGRRRWLAPLATWHSWDRATLTADNAFWTNAPESPELMRRAARALDLDMVALDYATFANGDLILWEANPYFYLPPNWRDGLMPTQRRLQQRIGGFYDCLANMMIDLVDSS